MRVAQQSPFVAQPSGFLAHLCGSVAHQSPFLAHQSPFEYFFLYLRYENYYHYTINFQFTFSKFL